MVRVPVPLASSLTHRCEAENPSSLRRSRRAVSQRLWGPNPAAARLAVNQYGPLHHAALNLTMMKALVIFGVATMTMRALVSSLARLPENLTPTTRLAVPAKAASALLLMTSSPVSMTLADRHLPVAIAASNPVLTVDLAPAVGTTASFPLLAMDLGLARNGVSHQDRNEGSNRLPIMGLVPVAPVVTLAPAPIVGSGQEVLARTTALVRVRTVGLALVGLVLIVISALAPIAASARLAPAPTRDSLLLPGGPFGPETRAHGVGDLTPVLVRAVLTSLIHQTLTFRWPEAAARLNSCRCRKMALDCDPTRLPLGEPVGAHRGAETMDSANDVALFPLTNSPIRAHRKTMLPKSNRQ